MQDSSDYSACIRWVRLAMQDSNILASYQEPSACSKVASGEGAEVAYAGNWVAEVVSAAYWAEEQSEAYEIGNGHGGVATEVVVGICLPAVVASPIVASAVVVVSSTMLASASVVVASTMLASAAVEACGLSV